MIQYHLGNIKILALVIHIISERRELLYLRLYYYNNFTRNYDEKFVE